MASPDSPNSQNFKNAILNSAGCNVILVDNKGLLSAPDYFTAIGNIKPIAEFTATFLDDLISKVGQMPLFLVGTSIGGHIAGVTSRKMTGTVSIAYGLDVAGPILDFLPEDSTIAKGDAKFVVLVHSNMFFFGSFRLAGDLDIFVNNGIIQLNCFIAFITTPTTPLPKVVLCSHLTSVAMMTKGMSNPTRYPMTKCSSFAEPIMGPCAVPSSVYFADYFIENSPLLGESGIRRIDTTDTTLSA
ncbi:lipase member H-like [Diabrotica virgifera virgifera]|nr:lipase member H-like [Diabrotica virgifera virgifera]XP_028128601.2 lipase member H-like [Diabrotica virgifera virgifera]